MEYRVCDNGIEIFDDVDFCPRHIFECGQIFSYREQPSENGETWTVLSGDRKAVLERRRAGFFIVTDSPEYFERFFDLETDYGAIKSELSAFDILKAPISFGYGIRILKQQLFETLISFIVSANNNIKRIRLILDRLRDGYGADMGGYHAFPTRERLLRVTESEFAALGAGYRDKYLYRTVRQADEETLALWSALPTVELRKRLLDLSGVGPKVADCILLFGFGRGDVFPVDTWIEKMYRKFYGDTSDIGREKIRQKLTDIFGELSGFAQQYLFYYMRSGADD